jgi:hypothetical protein
MWVGSARTPILARGAPSWFGVAATHRSVVHVMRCVHLDGVRARAPVFSDSLVSLSRHPPRQLQAGADPL